MKPLKFAALFLIVSSVASFTSPAQGTNPPTARVAYPGNLRLIDPPVLNVLTEPQRASLSALLQKQTSSAREIQFKLRQARQELLTNSVSGPFNETAVRESALAIAKLEAELTVQRMRALSEMQPPLSAAQMERIRQAGPIRQPENLRLPDSRPNRERILHQKAADPNGLPPKL